MKVTNATIEIRPRNKWEAIDLGILLARRHIVLLLSCWCLATLPIFILLTTIFWQMPLFTIKEWKIPLLPIIIFWWLKPIFERIPLYILSNVVFGNIPTIKETLLFWLTNLLSFKTLTDLTIHRISLSRSFNLAIKHLEGLTGAARKLRLKQLNYTSPPTQWLTIIFIHFEGIFYSLIISLFFMLIPSNIYTEESSTWTHSLLFDLPFWQVHLCCALYVLVVTFTESLYISCGFCLYLNSRTLLESWDIELVFRRLAERLANKVSCILLVACCVFTSSFTSEVIKAAPPQPNNPTIQLPEKITQSDQQATKKQLTPLELDKQDCQTQITSIVKSSPFYEQQEITLYRWKDLNHSSSHESNSNNFFIQFLGWFFSNIFTTSVWAIAIFIIFFIIWHYFNKPLTNTKKRKINPPNPKQLFGLAITPESLPSNILGEFEKYWQQGDTRQAVSLLYRALLSCLVHRYNIPLKTSHTEGEVLALARRLPCQTVISFTEQLTNQWLQLAYGHYQISPQQKQLLINGWQLMSVNNKEVGA